MKLRKPWKGPRREDLRLVMPCQFRMLCALTNVSPKKILHDFMNTLAMESFGLGKVKQEILIEYFLQCGYIQEHYTPENIRTIFSELNAVALLWPDKAGTKIINRHAKWRKMYHKYWFKKWRWKNRE